MHRETTAQTYELDYNSSDPDMPKDCKRTLILHHNSRKDHIPNEIEHQISLRQQKFIVLLEPNSSDCRIFDYSRRICNLRKILQKKIHILQYVHLYQFHASRKYLV